MKTILLIPVMLAVTVAGPSSAKDSARPTRTINEQALRNFAGAHYFALLGSSAGRYSARDIESGLRRHLTEWRARLIDEGYEIVPRQQAKTLSAPLPAHEKML